MTEPDDIEAESGEAGEPAEEVASSYAAKTTKASALKGSMLGAAMLGLGEVLEPEKTNTDVVIETTVNKDDDLGKKFDLDFGELDSLDPQTGDER